jgi:serine/threonine protein kinase
MTNDAHPVTTHKYCAPEVFHKWPRGRRSDVYSLGCVFLEILTVLAGKSIDDLDEFLGGDYVFHESQTEMQTWIQCLSKDANGVVAFLAQSCADMIQRKVSDRPYIEKIIERVSLATNKPDDLRSILFCDACSKEVFATNTNSPTDQGSTEEDDGEDWSVPEEFPYQAQAASHDIYKSRIICRPDLPNQTTNSSAKSAGSTASVRFPSRSTSHQALQEEKKEKHITYVEDMHDDSTQDETIYEQYTDPSEVTDPTLLKQGAKSFRRLRGLQSFDSTFNAGRYA